VEEAESGSLRDLLATDADLLASAIIEAEVVRAVRRVAPELTEKAVEVVAQVNVIEVSDTIRARAALLEPGTLRSLGALHLATAVEIGDAPDAVVTYDARMASASTSLGLVVHAPT
jgi:predicted nucleic acid-binding protein